MQKVELSARQNVEIYTKSATVCTYHRYMFIPVPAMSIAVPCLLKEQGEVDAPRVHVTGTEVTR